MLFTLSILGIFFSVILLIFNAGKYKSTIYLGLFFFIISLYGITQYAILYSKSAILLSILIHFAFIFYLPGPLMYWYVRSVLNDDARLKKGDLLHLLPSGIYFLCLIPFLISPWSYKFEISGSVVNDPSFLYNSRFTTLSEIFPVRVVFLSRPVLLFAYTLWSVVIFIRYLNDKNRSKIFTKQRYMKKWLIVFLGFLSILVISHILLMLEPIPVFLAINMLQILSATGLWGLLVSPLFFPGILYGMPRPPESRANIVVKKEEPVFNGEKNSLKTKKQIQIFESDYLLSIGEKADSYMTEFKPFLQPDFNLVQFSVLTNLPIHHLAFFFREIRKQTFIDYRNRFRIDYAKNLILEGKTSELTLEAIGIISGFTSRNTFFTAFKKVEGTSPGAFASQFTA